MSKIGGDPDKKRIDRLAEKRDSFLTQRATSGFQSWLTEPLVQVILSTIPAGSVPESLPKLLEATYRAGFSNGAGALVESILRKTD